MANYFKLAFISELLLPLYFTCCSTFHRVEADVVPIDNDILSYEQLLNRMRKYENGNCASEKERLTIYAMTFLQDGLHSGKILKEELDKYTYLFEFKVQKDGRIRSVAIQNSNFEGCNDKYFLEYLIKLPQCEFWKDYSGSDKDTITTFVVPLHF